MSEADLIAERAAFEAWIRTSEGHPFAGQFATLMCKAWQARAALQASPVAPASEGEDAARYRWLRANVKEEPLRLASYGSEIAPDMRLKHSFPVLVSYDSIGQQITLDNAVDAARTASLGRVG